MAIRWPWQKEVKRLEDRLEQVCGCSRDDAGKIADLEGRVHNLELLVKLQKRTQENRQTTARNWTQFRQQVEGVPQDANGR